MKTNFCLIHQYLPIPLDKKSVTGKHFDFCKYLCNRGVDVTIITANNSHVFKRSVKVNAFYKTLNISGIKVKFIKTIPHTNPRGFVRILNWFIFSFWAWYFITVKYYKNIFVSVLPQTNILSIYFSITSRLRSRVFLEIRDIWPLSGKYLMGLNEKSLVYKLLGYIEKIGYKISNYIISPLPKFKDYLINEIKMFDYTYKYLSFPNGISKEAIKTSNENISEPNKSIKKNKILKFGYFGGLGVSNKVENIIYILMKSKFNFILDIYGSGSEKNKLLELSDSRINFHNPISRFDAISIMKKYDYLCMAQPDADVYKYGIASLKLVDYLVSNIPIIQFCKKKYEFIETHGIGYFLDTDSEEQQNNNLNIIFNLNKNRLSIINNQSKYLIDNLILDKYFKNFYKILK